MITRLLQPSPLRSFALKALGIFLLWYVLYELWLLPDGRLDHWVALRVIDGAALVTRLFGFEVWMLNRVVTIAGNNGIEMVDGCTGISAIGLFLGFVWAYPGQIAHACTSRSWVLPLSIWSIFCALPPSCLCKNGRPNFLTSPTIIPPPPFSTWSYSCFGCYGYVSPKDLMVQWH